MDVKDYTEKELKLFKKLLKVLGTENYKLTLSEAVSILDSERIYKRKNYVKKAIKKFIGDPAVPIKRKGEKVFRTDL